MVTYALPQQHGTRVGTTKFAALFTINKMNKTRQIPPMLTHLQSSVTHTAQSLKHIYNLFKMIRTLGLL